MIYLIEAEMLSSTISRQYLVSGLDASAQEFCVGMVKQSLRLSVRSSFCAELTWVNLLSFKLFLNDLLLNCE